MDLDPRAHKIAQLEDLTAAYPDRAAMPQHHRQALEALEAEVKAYGDTDAIKADAEKTKAEFDEFQAYKAAKLATASVI